MAVPSPRIMNATAGLMTRARLFILGLACMAALCLPARPAQAICFFPCTDQCTLISNLTDVVRLIVQRQAQTWLIFQFRMLLDEAFMEYVVFQFQILPTVEHMTQQMTTVAMHQTLAIGMFIDARQQMETQRTFQRLTAQAHKDYHPSVGMCTFGTNVRSLANADARAALAKSVLDEYSIKRQLGSANVSASEGVARDRESRLRLFKTRFCDASENNRLDTSVSTGLGLVCAATVQPDTMGRDAGFIDTVMLTRTLEFDAADPALDQDEPDVFAMASNLYAHNLPSPIASPLLANPKNRDDYLDFRSVVAKRSIAENSFHTLVSMKAMGSPLPAAGGAADGSAADTRQYMEVLLSELGATPAEAQEFLGERPSYLAQLEVLSKKMYQRPGFYVDLYDKPANVARKGVAMQAIGLMLDRDIYNSQLRSEILMSMLLEMRLMRAQEAVQNNMGKLEKK